MDLFEFLFEFLHTNRSRAVIAETALALFLFFADPLGVVAYKARVIDDSWAVFTQFWHPSASAGKLAVILIDQETLDAWHINWPLTYGQVLGLIHGLACAKATGVFFDFTLSRKYPDLGEEKQLQDAIEKADSFNGAPDWPGCGDEHPPPAAIKVFFGKADHIDTPLAERMDRGDHAFPIDVEAEDSVYPAGKTEFPDAPLPTSQVSPAFGVVRRVPELWQTAQANAARSTKPNGDMANAGSDAKKTGDDPAGLCSSHDPRPQCWFEPLLLQWSAAVDPNQKDVENIQSCRGDPGWPTLLAGMFGITKQERFQPCPPILTLKAEDLFRDRNYIDANGNPAELLEKRFVFVGTRLAGLNDQIYSPVHGYLPGVYKHAVATANLTDTAMKNRTSYPAVPRPWLLGVLVVITYVLIEAVKEFSGGLPRRNLIIGAAFLTAFFAWVAIICVWKWPGSLVLTVLGYYAGAVLFVRASGS
jgi:CHASE2 domain-containing sensor protein